MKKIILIFLTAMVLLWSVSGCANDGGKAPGTTSESQTGDLTLTDIWDGSVATAFAGGEGTEGDPYRITSAEELAFLAQEINSGKEYKGKSFSLLSDIDLADIGWTPIGNGTYSFEGRFDGNGHSISNLKVTEGASFDQSFSLTESQQYASGLFGTCVDPIIRNLTLEHVEITVRDTEDRDETCAGALSGRIYVNTAAEISLVKIGDARINVLSVQGNTLSKLRVGGVAGKLFAYENTDTQIDSIQSDLKVSLKDGYASVNDVGGLFGVLATMHLWDVKNCASNLWVEVDPENCYNQQNEFGAFGTTEATDQTVSMTSIFSKVTVNKIYDELHGAPAYTAHAIIGQAYHAKQQDGTVSGGYRFENLFGFVEQTEEAAGARQIREELYDLSSLTEYTEVNCQGCETLPATHGFDGNVWELSDLNNPTIQ